MQPLRLAYKQWHFLKYGSNFIVIIYKVNPDNSIDNIASGKDSVQLWILISAMKEQDL